MARKRPLGQWRPATGSSYAALVRPRSRTPSRTHRPHPRTQAYVSVKENAVPCFHAARPRQAIDDAATDWIGRHRKHDRHRASRLLQRRGRGRGRCQDDVWSEREQLRRILAISCRISRRAPAHVEPQIASLAPAEDQERRRYRQT